MFYAELYKALKESFDSKDVKSVFPELNLSIETVQMQSTQADLLYGSPVLFCDKHKHSFDSESLVSDSVNVGFDTVDVKDFDISCNKSFEYYILKRADIIQAEGAIIFFHGLNEKKWDKYLPWAYEFAQRTNKAVILFPIAFHMNRADEVWSNRYKMEEIANFRRTNFQENSNTSYVNAAISSRLEAYPQRVFWSGFQTYSDIISVIKNIQNGSLTSISKDASFDLFGYSIGSFLSMIIKMADPFSLFKNSKLFCFCGGMTIDRMFPISKYIMDARAAIKMQMTFAELLSSDFKADYRLAHFQNHEIHRQESWFKTMLRYNYYQKEREGRIAELQDQIKAYVLEKDQVAPPIEALNTFRGGYRNINVDVEIEDFDFEYSHVTPFPLSHKIKAEVTDAFTRFVESACNFYTK